MTVFKITGKGLAPGKHLVEAWQPYYQRFMDSCRGLPHEAAPHWKRAADQGQAEGQFNYGLCLQMGYGVDVDRAEAFRYFKLAAIRGT